MRISDWSSDVCSSDLASEIFSEITGESVNDSPEAVHDTVVALAEYFSSRFQLYGRKLDIRFFRGEGNGATELLGGGKERALSDAVTAAKQHGSLDRKSTRLNSSH